jgi:16S rRNA (cytosine1402-N4)-methyltransferase
MAAEASRPGVHESVMVGEVLEYLACAPGKTMVDATIGPGGHAAAILERILPGGRLIGIDRDPGVVEKAREKFAGQPVTLINDNYQNLDRILDELGVGAVDGVLFDCGMSLDQLTTAERGFSVRLDGPLDMRLNPREAIPTAAEVVNRLPEEELARILREIGGERRAHGIARAIAAARQQTRISTTAQLTAVIAAALGARARRGRLHPATKSFMALRIYVNGELDALHTALAAAIRRTRIGGRIVAISYHSGEARETKGALRSASDRSQRPPFSSGEMPMVRLLTKKAVKPSREEVARNPRARSATLRAAERI